MNLGGDGPVWSATSLADGPSGTVRRKVIAAARKVRVADLGPMVGAASAASEAAGYLREIHRAPTMPAVERYGGIVYDHLDAGSLSAAARGLADQHLAIVSGLFGLLRGGDRIPAYRLLMLADLPGLGKLHHVWRSVVPAAIRAAVDEDGVIINLLSGEYAAAVGPDLQHHRRVIDVTFLQPGGKRISSYGGKQAKGWLTRHLLERGGVSPELLADFPQGRLLDADDTSWMIEVTV